FPRPCIAFSYFGSNLLLDTSELSLMFTTEALKTLTYQLQRVYDSVSLFCHAVPYLREAIAEPNMGPNLPPPDCLDEPVPVDRLSKAATQYQQVLAAQLVLACFSFLEQYVHGAIAELIQFHGGEDQLADFVSRRVQLPTKPRLPRMRKSRKK